ncbi:MAG: hypothetical protein AAF958_00600 [Planctomycetota bacterium]
MNIATHLHSSQPIGLHRHAAHFCLLPFAKDVDSSVMQALMRGELPMLDDLPASWRFFHHAANNRPDKAIGLLVGDDPIVSLNRMVLTGESTPLAAESVLHQALAFSLGLSDQTPSRQTPSPERLSDALPVELSAWIGSVAATAQMIQGHMEDACQGLLSAAESCHVASPVLAALLHAQIASLVPNPVHQMQQMQAAIRLASDAAPRIVAELHLALGAIYQARGGTAIVEAIRTYQTALQTDIDEQADVALMAELQNNLATCFLATDDGNHLRAGIAVQTLRHARALICDEQHNELWARITTNLAGALVYAPSSHPQSNLTEAVELYEELLQIRVRDKDPVAYARTSLNQANALAHLGMFGPAMEKAAEAHKLLRAHEEVAAAEAAAELIETIHQARADANRQADANHQADPNQRAHLAQPSAAPEAVHGSA